MNFSLNDMFVAGSGGLCLVLAFVVFVSRRDRNDSSYYLGALLLLAGVIELLSMLYVSNNIIYYPRAIGLDYTLHYLIIPTYYFYFQSTLRNKKISIKERLIHYTPAFVVFVSQIPMIFSSKYQKLEYYDELSTNSSFRESEYLLIVKMLLFLAYCIVQSIQLYTYYISRSKKEKKDNRIELNWLLVLQIAFFSDIFLLSVRCFFPNGLIGSRVEFLVSGITVNTIVICTGLLMNPVILYGGIKKTVLEAPKKKYSHSSLSDERRKEIVNAVCNCLFKEQRFLDSKLTLNEVSEILGISRHQISQSINQEYDKSFSDYVNQYRIEYALKLLEGKESENYTVSGIGFACGFNSKTAFYNAFKKELNTTPGLYLRGLKKSK